MNQALYPVKKMEWCAYALFTQNEDKKRAHCTINTHKRDANKAQSLEGYLWAVTTLKKGKNANQVSNRYTCNRCETSTNHHTCRIHTAAICSHLQSQNQGQCYGEAYLFAAI